MESNTNLLCPADHLEECLDAPFVGREREYVNDIANALGELEQTLMHHFADAASPQGVFAEVDTNRRGLVRRVTALRQELAVLLGQTAELQEWAQKAARPGFSARVAPLGHRVGELVAAVRQLIDQEADVVFESVNTDLGAGD